DLRSFERDLIMQLPGIPPEMLGVLINSNRSTIDGSGYIFDSQVIRPRLEFRRNELQEKLVPEYDERLILDYVDPVSDDQALQLDAAKAFPGALSVDEQRERAGLPALPNGTGKVHMVPIKYTPTELVMKPADWTDASLIAHDNPIAQQMEEPPAYKRQPKEPP